MAESSNDQASSTSSVKAYMSTGHDQYGYYWMAILSDGIGAAKQGGFSSHADAAQAAWTQKFKTGVEQVWSRN